MAVVPNNDLKTTKIYFSFLSGHSPGYLNCVLYIFASVYPLNIYYGANLFISLFNISEMSNKILRSNQSMSFSLDKVQCYLVIHN